MKTILELLTGVAVVALTPVWAPILFVGMFGYVLWGLGGAVIDAARDLLGGRS